MENSVHLLSISTARAIKKFVHYYNHARYHESLNNVTPADMYYGRYHDFMDRRAVIKQETLQQRRKDNLEVITCH